MPTPTKAEVTLKLTPTDFNRIIQALTEAMEIQEDMVKDPAIKQEDKQIAGQEMMEYERLLRMLA